MKHKLNVLNVLIVDANYHLHMGLYKGLLDHQRVTVTKAISVRQVFDEETYFLKHPYDLIIVNPLMPDHGHYGGIDATCHGKITGLLLYRDKFEHMPGTKVVVWAGSEEEVLEHWGKNVVERIIIPRKTHFCFLEVAKKYLHF